MLMDLGVWYAVGAYVAWVLLPAYWKGLHHVPAVQLISHRVVWSCLMLAGMIVLSRQTAAFLAAIMRPRLLAFYAIPAALLTVNWLVFLLARNPPFLLLNTPR